MDGTKIFELIGVFFAQRLWLDDDVPAHVVVHSALIVDVNANRFLWRRPLNFATSTDRLGTFGRRLTDPPDVVRGAAFTTRISSQIERMVASRHNDFRRLDAVHRIADWKSSSKSIAAVRFDTR